MRRITLSVTVGAVVAVFLWAFGTALLRTSPQIMMSSPERVMMQRFEMPKSVAPGYAGRAAQAPLEVQPASVQSAAGKNGVVPALQLARAGQIDLLVGDIDRATDAVSSIVRREGGDVLSLHAQRAADPSNHPMAQMQARVPASNFDATLSALEQSGKVRSHSIQAEDLSAQIVDAAARLRNLRRTESDILRIMDRSGSVAQVLEAENQLSSVREQIETLDAEAKQMHARVAYSTIRITLEAEAISNPTEPSTLSQLGNAWRSALHGVGQFTVGVVAVALWVAAFLPYLLLLAAILWGVRARRAARGAAS